MLLVYFACDIKHAFLTYYFFMCKFHQIAQLFFLHLDQAGATHSSSSVVEVETAPNQPLF